MNPVSWRSLLLLSFAIIALSAMRPAAAQAVVATVQGAPGTSLAIDVATNRIYVANEFAGQVIVVDGATLVATSVPVGRRPQYIAVNSRTNRIYVSNGTDQSLSVIDGSTLGVTTLPIGGSGPIVVNEITNTIFVLRRGNNGEVTIVDGATRSWYSIDTASHTPIEQVINTATNKLYVSHKLSGEVRAIDMNSRSDHPPTVGFQIAGQPTALALDQSANRVYVLSDDARSPITLIDGATNTMQRITAPGHAVGPVAVVANPTARKAYAAFANEVIVVDGNTQALRYLPTGPVLSMAVDAIANRTYVLDATRALSIIDGATDARTVLVLPSDARAVAVNPNTRRVYIAGAAGLIVVEATASPPPPPPQAVGVNVQGLWWASPGGVESGWGLNIAHQGDVLFVAWFTYDVDGQPLWLAMSNGIRTGPNSYTGDLFRLSGPPFSATVFDSTRVIRTRVGSATFAFSDTNNGTMAATVNGANVTKAITRQFFSTPVPVCSAGAAPGPLPNYQDLWWKSPANSESGWGLFVVHQGDILFVTWFTYGADGRALWLVGSSFTKTGNGTYSGTLYRTTGPPFSMSPWDPSRVSLMPAGSGTLVFSDAGGGTFSYTLEGVTQSKPMTRLVYGSPATVCR